MSRELAKLSSPEAVQAALDEFDRLGREHFLAKYSFGRARDYLIRNPRSGEWADSKAIAGVAFGIQFPDLGPLNPAQFSGGESTVARRLSLLGFSMERVGDDWSAEEVALIVSDYLSMLTCELTGQPYNKSLHRRRLAELLRRRSEGAIEFKHCNISAVLIELGFPYLKGYKPRANFQRRLLMEAVSELVAGHKSLDHVSLSAVERPAAISEVVDFSKVEVAPPKRGHVVREPESAPYARGVRRDYLEREARNRSLGLAGEEFALRFERWRLGRLGQDRLAERVEHVSASRGDGLGYDILSFEPDGRQRFIEVKTTAFGEKTPFFVSDNEVRFARHQAEQYKLYRLFEFRATPRMFELAGAIENHGALDATTYRVSFT